MADIHATSLIMRRMRKSRCKTLLMTGMERGEALERFAEQSLLDKLEHFQEHSCFDD